MFLQPNWILALVCAFTYYEMGKFEARHAARRNDGVLWSGISIAISALVIQELSGGWVAVLLMQIVFFLAITIYRLLRET